MASHDVSFPSAQESLARDPSRMERFLDRSFRALTKGLAWFSALTVILIVASITYSAWPAMKEFGAGFMGSTVWDPTRHQFGVLPQIWGTLYSSILALFIAGFFGIGIAIFLSEDFLPPKVENVLKNLVELLAAIPSVIYGLWGIYVLIPAILPLANWCHEQLGWLPFFSTPLMSVGMLPAALVLAIMILPTVSALSRAALVSVPQRLRDGAVGLGATRWETILRIVVPTSKTGLFGAVILGFGRALGETMALAMLVGSRNVISWSLLSPADTLAALLANSFPEASGLEVGALMYAALVLLGITLVVNILGSLVIWRASAELKGLR
jgi:phosphate transport system permease protein